MKLFLIKIGKAVNVIRHDGLIKGIMRIMRAFLSMFQKVGRGDMLFVTNGIGDSARYRTRNIVEELSLHGLCSSVTVQDNPFLWRYADKFRIFVFHRTLFTPNIKKMIEKIKEQGGKIIFETDDLTFDPKYFARLDYFKSMNSFEKKLYECGLGSEILNDPYVKTCTTTTTYLAKILEGYNKEVFIVTNKLSHSDLEITEKIIQEPRTKNQELIRIGYFSGTKSHDRDLDSISEALAQILQKYPQVELFLAGPLKIPDKLGVFSSRIKRLSFVPRNKNFENIAGVDINIVPLEPDSAFCEAKSELKFFEAGILEVPTVASTTQTFREAIEDGVDGFVAGGVLEWTEKLEKLILDEKLRKSMGEKAREKVLRKYTTKNSHNEEYYNYLKSKL